MDPHDPRRWDAMAARFDDLVCHVLAEDRGRIVAKRIAAEARKLRGRGSGRRLVAVDFGCGTGRALALLARHFDRVIGTDVSGDCLAAARVPESVELVRADLGRPRVALPVPRRGADLGLCVNVAIMPDERLRSRILANVARHVRTGGRLFLVVPAHESELLVRRRFAEWTGSRARTGRTERPVEGLFQVGGALTKLWTREELETLGPRLGFRILSIERVEYSWSTEFEHPPRSFRAPYPWDWLAVLVREVLT
ncbi:MAG: class I SAM-dependent DNA methyltransferase [Planctomycetota bacterium]